MKKLRCTLCAAMLLCVAGTAVFLIILPDTIPAHYNLYGEVDRFGSKYENLIWPAVVALVGGLFLFLSSRQRGEHAKTSAKVLLYTGICMVFYFTALGFYCMGKEARYDPAAPAVSMAGFLRFTGLAIGVPLILLGNIMPKARKNAFFGLRTKWSMANDRVWQKSQRFGGAASVICGLSMIAASFFLSGLRHIFLVIAIMGLWLVLCIAASYHFFREDAQKMV